ncbi:hypothetical protein M432DRAFT_365171 [Thermoascus aurantiacus ATCC 26904]
MSNPEERAAEDAYEEENDPSPVAATPIDNSYVGETKYEVADVLPVQRDEDDYEDPVQPPYSNSDEQLEQDEREAIDERNILKGDRTRHAQPRTANRYNEGPDEEDLPAEVRDGTVGRSARKRVT